MWRIEGTYPLPRFMIVHGTIDTLVPYEDGRHFFRLLTKQRHLDSKSSVSKTLSGVLAATEELPDSDERENAWNSKDLFVKLPATHHAFNFVVSPRTLALSDAVVNFLADLLYQERSASLSKL
jgi:hypothetical protein